MEWIRRNPKSAAALSALTVLLVVVLVWGLGGSDTPTDEPTLGAPSASPTPTRAPLTVLPSPSAAPTSIAEAIQGFPSSGMGAGPGLLGDGATQGLPPHRVVIEAGSDGPLLGVGWRIPTADGKRAGKDLTYKNRFRHAATAYGSPDYAQLYTRVGPDSSVVWCTVSVDGRVVERKEVKGPWGGVFCQG